MPDHLPRAWILFQQGRYDLAERELEGELAADPDSAVAHALLAFCLLERDELARATEEARRSIVADPESPLGHRAHAVVLMKRNHVDEALAAAEEAVRLDPEDASQHALVGSIQLARRVWPAALAAAERGLAQDAEDVDCTNIRATALIQLGRRAEAGATLESALARNPESAATHASRGWALLHEGNAEKALEHFREALRLEPTSEFARAGIVEALKARHRIYAIFLRYFLWMSRLGKQTRWGIVLGGYFGYRVLLDQAQAHPGFAPYAWPLIAAYIVFALMTWISVPLFNLLLRLNKFGRLALSREQTVASNWTGAALGLALVSAPFWIFGHDPVDAFGAFGTLTFGPLVIPITGTFACPEGWPRLVMKLVTLGLFLVRVGGFALMLVLASRGQDDAAGQAFETSMLVFFYGILGAQFLANALIGVRVKK